MTVNVASAKFRGFSSNPSPSLSDVSPPRTSFIYGLGPFALLLVDSRSDFTHALSAANIDALDCILEQIKPVQQVVDGQTIKVRVTTVVSEPLDRLQGIGRVQGSWYETA